MLQWDQPHECSKKFADETMDNQQPSPVKYRRNTHPKKQLLDDISGPEMLRTCVKCGVPKTLDNFAIAKANRFGRHRHCKACGAVDTMKTYWEDPEPYRKKGVENVQSRRKIRKIAVLEHYGKSCACCGESNSKLLTVDHIVPIGGTKARVEAGHRCIVDWLVTHDFPEGFQILCWNCNIGRYHNGGICPHKEGSQAIAQASSGKSREVPEILLPWEHQDMVETLEKFREVPFLGLVQ